MLSSTTQNFNTLECKENVDFKDTFKKLDVFKNLLLIKEQKHWKTLHKLTVCIRVNWWGGEELYVNVKWKMWANNSTIISPADAKDGVHVLFYSSHFSFYFPR